MATYVIGDVHGCLDELKRLLLLVQYNENKDTLWFTGDLVNVGPKSLETLRFIYERRQQAICVLGNHDLALLGIAHGAIDAPKQKTSCQDILDAEDKSILLSWLSQQSLAHYHPEWDVLLTHAGTFPDWSVESLLNLAKELEASLSEASTNLFYDNLFGNEPSHWDEALTGWSRIRFIVNALTRMRYLTQSHALDLTCKAPIQEAPSNLYPWFQHPKIRQSQTRYVFGHWSALLGETQIENALAIDTGCVWGNGLTALRLPDGKRFKVPSKCYSTY